MIYGVLDETQNGRKTIGGTNNYTELWKEPICPCSNLQIHPVFKLQNKGVS